MSSSATNRFPIILLGELNMYMELKSAKPHLSDEALMDRLKAEDKEALGQLFRRYGKVVLSVGRRILRDDSEAEDFAQDLFLFLQRKCRVFDRSKSSVGSWIVQMAYHRAIERRRYLAARHFYTREEVESSASLSSLTPQTNSMAARQVPVFPHL